MAKFELSVYKSIQPGGIKAAYNVPDTLQQVVDAIGEQRALAIIVKNVVYHSVLTALRSELSERIEAKTEQKWLTETKTVNGKEVQVVIEGDEDYTRRAVAANAVSVDTLTTDLQELADEPDNAFLEFAKEPERKPRAPRKMPKSIELMAQKYSDEGVITAVAAKLAEKLGRPVQADVENVGWAIKEHQDRLAAAALVQAKADLAGLTA